MIRPDHLAICRHRLRGIRAPYLLILQHHLVDAPSRIAAPLVPLAQHERGVLRPVIEVEGQPHQALLLAMAAVPVTALGPVVGSGLAAWDDITKGLEVVFNGLPQWLPR